MKLRTFIKKQLPVWAFWLLIWQTGSLLIDLPLFFPGPMGVFKDFLSLLRSDDLIGRTLYSMSGILAGFFLGLAGGILLSFLANKFSAVRSLFEPIIRLMKLVPIASFIVLALFFLSPEGLKIFIAMIMVLPIIYANMDQAIGNLPKDMLEITYIFKPSKWAKYQLFYIPSLAPYLKAACRSAFSLAWKSGLAAEMIAMSGLSLGNAIYDSKIYLEMARLFSWTIWVIIVSLLLEKSLFLIIDLLLALLIKLPPGFAYSKEPQGQGDEDAELLICKDVSLSYDETPLIKDFNLEVRAPETICIYGKSGIGKTSLLRILAGLEHIDSGSVKRGSVSMLFQEDRLFEEFSSISNLRPFSRDQATITEGLKAVGLENYGKYPAGKLSGGMRRRLALLRALIYRAPILLLDEPTAGLDPETKSLIWSYMRESFDRNKRIVIISSNDPQEAEALGAKRIINL